MFTAVIENPVLNYQVFPVFAVASDSSTNPDVHSARGAWEIVDEEELASEMPISSFDTTSQISSPDFDADDFERLYQWFLS